MPFVDRLLRTFAVLAPLALVAASGLASPADAQWRQPSPFAAAGASPPPAGQVAPALDVPGDPGAAALAVEGAREPSAGRTVLGAALGGVVGAALGGIVGASIADDGCDEGNPDDCLGEAIPGFLWGAGIGSTVGIPAGAHLGNGRRGSVGRSLLASAAIFGAELVALNLLVDDGRSEHKSTVVAIALAAPVVQTIASVHVERRTSGP
jgi:hypothetical protein